MSAFHIAATLCLIATTACSQQSGPPEARPFTDADRAAILATLGLKADPQGQVMNACSELSTPQFLQAELGGSVGTATLFAISGGPNTPTCYGDGPDLHLMIRNGADWREVYSARGRMLIILPTSTAGVRDIGDGGPGLSFPVWVWNGTRYADAGRAISDAELSKINPIYLP
jgi:hypothetical protein